MTLTFPFQVAAAKAATDSPRQFAILAPVGELDGYAKLFEDFGYGGGVTSWQEHLETIIEDERPDLLNHLEFDSVGETLLLYADSPAAVREFMACVLPYFGDFEKFRKYLNQTDPSDYFE
ncbi:hypothetical protein Q5H93_02690 [Hymenobacter sp. ASUV-10]|uniref:Uncharacterized protein n=1 Tax=Hymenobacter aranciens TaxID=3063996 RepID=A0ABT9B750_9BACT|nr:hypothetical protein [Hymenobacter sp. ASUV-10]MDO7873625.1 hypothetical protein [Hymenobacter sp. ASUV-10]